MITFDQAQKKDIEIIRNLAREIWYSHYTSIISTQQIEYMLQKMYACETIQEELNQGYCWDLIKINNKPVGFVSYNSETDGLKRTMKLNKLYILIEYHGKGIGQEALAHVKGKAVSKKANKLYLTVNKANKKAISAYLKFGFSTEMDIITNIGNGFVMDDYIMALHIK